ncbi:MAG: hypothetical protein JXQ76_12455 [Campylobacterales bacterium]|nr:hypothetical protein [Campylobacterales bacterium]
MQTITQSQIKSITKNIVQLSRESKPLQHSAVLEIFAKRLGYKDYNALIAKLKNQKKESSPSNTTTDPLSISIQETPKS